MSAFAGHTKERTWIPPDFIFLVAIPIHTDQWYMEAGPMGRNGIKSGKTTGLFKMLLLFIDNAVFQR